MQTSISNIAPKTEGRRASRIVFLVLISIVLLGAPANAQMWISAYYVDNTYTTSMSDIPWSKMTHVIHDAMSADSSGNITGIPGANADAFTAAAHAAGVKAILGIGGTLTAGNLSTFSNNVVNFVNAHHYDGVDMDFESGNYNTNPDQSNYINLINTLRNSLGSSKVMSIAVFWGAGLETVVQNTATKLDQVNVMCYDMDQFLSYTYYNEAINRLTGETQGACAAEGAHFATFVPAAKIGLGVAFYGRVWSGCANSSCSDGLHDPMQPFSGSPTQTTIYYRDLIASSYWSYPQQWDSVRGGSYISINQSGSSNDRFISFTGTQQINAIVQVAKSSGYGGIMSFDLEYDFVSSATGDGRHPLAASTYTAVFGSAGPPVSGAPVISSGAPSGTLSTSITQTTISILTNENATCKYSTVAGIAYSSMPLTFTTTGGISHSTLVTNLISGNSYNYYARCMDTSGNADTSDYLISFSVPQTVSGTPGVSLTPNSGTGSTQAFTLQVIDPRGASTVQQIDIVFDSADSNVNSCGVEYNPLTRTLYLRSDNNASWAQAVIGSSTVLQNSQCSVNPATSLVSASGNTFSLTLAMSFPNAYAGTRPVITFVADQSGWGSGWQTLGSWTVPFIVSVQAAPPTLTVTPNSGSGASATFVLKGTDTGGYASIAQMNLSITSSLQSPNGCNIDYSPSNNTLALASNLNSSTSAVLGSSTVLQNSQCTINVKSVSVSGSGNTLTLSVPITFSYTYAGGKTLYTFGADNTGLSSGWQNSGSWTVPKKH